MYYVYPCIAIFQGNKQSLTEARIYDEAVISPLYKPINKNDQKPPEPEYETVQSPADSANVQMVSNPAYLACKHTQN